MPFTHPSDAREARLQGYFKKRDWFSYFGWPAWAREAILLEHKPRSQRFNLFYFFVGNGLEPSLAVDWIRSKDAHGDYTEWEIYDKSALDDLKGMVKRVKDGTFFSGEKHVFDLFENKVVLM